MSGNRYRPHVVVILEDDANRQLANGFKNHWAVAQRNLVVQPEAGGWRAVLDVFESDHVPSMRKNHSLIVVLLLDFDEKGEDRRSTCEERIPDDLKERVFLLGASDAPEDLKKAMKMTLEQIGTALADDCNLALSDQWAQSHLAHNIPELQRMTPIIRPIHFQDS